MGPPVIFFSISFFNYLSHESSLLVNELDSFLAHLIRIAHFTSTSSIHIEKKKTIIQTENTVRCLTYACSECIIRFRYLVIFMVNLPMLLLVLIEREINFNLLIRFLESEKWTKRFSLDFRIWKCSRNTRNRID